MKNIYLVSTDKDSPLVLRDADKKLVKHTLITQWYGKKQHIYITSDEKIKAGYWSFDGENPYKWTSGDVEDCLYNPGVNNYKGCKKIILTTDQDLIKDDVQEIDDVFLNWFIKNPTCEYVEVKFETIYTISL